MASAREWLQGARPRTLGAAIAPVAVGTAAGTFGESVLPWRGVAALVVSVSLQIGVNYANDYSDGVRGTDANRRGPLRLTASGVAKPAAVKRAAQLSFLIGAAVGLWLSLIADWRLLILGALCIAAAAFYTGGPKPYGYLGLGELMVLLCFGFAATAGSAYVQTRHVNGTVWVACLVVGLPAVAILLCNNVRDIPTDVVAGKRTLAVRIGDRRARWLYVASIVGSLVGVAVIAARYPMAWVAFVGIMFVTKPVRLMLTATDPPSLVAALVGTASFQLVSSLFLAAALWVS